MKESNQANAIFCDKDNTNWAAGDNRHLALRNRDDEKMNWSDDDQINKDEHIFT